MFERFTHKARTVVISARAEAAERGDQLRPVYMLYALTTGEGVAARALAGLGVDAARVQRELDRPTALGRPLEGLGDEPDSGDAEALAAIGIDLGEIKRRIEDSLGTDPVWRHHRRPGPHPARFQGTEHPVLLRLSENDDPPGFERLYHHRSYPCGRRTRRLALCRFRQSVLRRL